MDHLDKISFSTSHAATHDELNELFGASWPQHESRDFGPILSRSLAHVCAFHGTQMIGFVNLAWDGGAHAFLLDTTVRPGSRRRGIGRRLVLLAVEAARLGGVEWVHVDYEAHLEPFYRSCGFGTTAAGLLRTA